MYQTLIDSDCSNPTHIYNAKKLKASPLRGDPTRTATLRRVFQEDVRRRFKRVARKVRKLVVEEDALGIKADRRDPLTSNTRWRFKTSTEKIDLFTQWLKSNLGIEVLDSLSEESEIKYWEEYVQQGYDKGAGRAFDQVRKSAIAAGEKFDGAKEEFFRSFQVPETVEKTRLLASRVLTDLEGVTEQTATRLSKRLLDGLVTGSNPETIAQGLVTDLGFSIRSAERIARTEIIRAHAEGQLDAMERLGVDKIGVMVEWSTAGDGRVCPKCKPLDTIVLRVKEAHGLLPRHPNCRCAFLPANLGEPSSDQIRGKEKVEEAMLKSIKAERPGEPALVARKKSKWMGATRKINKHQPHPAVPASDKGKKESLAPAKPKTKSPKPLGVPKKLTDKIDKAPILKPGFPPPKAPKVTKPKAPPKPPPAPPKPAKPKPVEFTPEGLPTRETVKIDRDLPGSTGPKLVTDAKGKKWVMKEGLDPEHVRSEALADELYRELGFKVPKSGIVETPNGPVKFSEFLEDAEPLGRWLTNNQGSAAALKLQEQISEGFVADSLLGNWDVAGMSMDNILVKNGVAYRIDNGGALLFRAQGAKKKGWGKVVKELDDLVDPSVNPQTAQLFKGLTDSQIREQARDLAKNRDKLLGAIKDKKLKKVISDRLDFLEDKFAPKLGVTTQFAKEVEKAGLNGKVLSTDQGSIEDLNVLVYQDKIAGGKTVTKLRMKLTPEGAGKLQATIANDLEKAVAVSSVKDDMWDTILSSAKTINHHAADGNYNEATLAKLRELSIKLEDLSKTATDPVLKEMVSYYKPITDDLVAAVANQKTTGQIIQFDLAEAMAKEAKKAPDKTAKRVIVRKQNQFSRNRIEDGKSVGKTSGRNSASGDHLEWEEGKIGVRFHDVEQSTDTRRGGRSLDNLVEITVPGKPTEKNIQEGFETLAKLGIDVTPSTETYEEIVYLTKGFKSAVHIPQGYTSRNLPKAVIDRAESLKLLQQLEDNLEKWADLPEEKMLDNLRDFVATNTGYEPWKQKGYNPSGVLLNKSNKNGYRYWERWDLSNEEIEEKLDNLVVRHEMAESPINAVEGMLNSGGEFTPTNERLRKGIDIGAGMSPQTDIKTGGSDYSFTRLRPQPPKVKQARKGLYFKKRVIKRSDVVHYSGDQFGETTAITRAFRAHDLETMRDYSHSSGNELLFKNGLSIIDDIDKIVVEGKSARDSIITSYKKRGYDKLPDGRAIEDVIIDTQAVDPKDNWEHYSGNE